jgi:predicted hydrolase (HD superfamily)
MIEYKIKVEELGVEGATGEIIMQVYNYIERVQKMKEAGMVADPDKGMEAMACALAMAKKQCISVDVTIYDKNFKDIEELSFYKEGSEIVNYVVGIISNGIPIKKT